MSLTTGLARIERAACRAGRLLGGLLAATVLILAFTQVVARYVFQTPLSWTEELARYSFVWLSFVGASFVAAEDKHMRVDVVSKWLNASMNKAMELTARLVVIAACLAFLYGGASFLQGVVNVTSPALNMPMYLLYGIPYVSMGIIAAHECIRVIQLMGGSGEPIEVRNWINTSDESLGGGL